MSQYLTELMVGGMLLLFGIVIKSFTRQLTESLDSILERVEKLQTELHAHIIDDAKMWTRIDAEVHGIFKRLDRELPNGNGNNGRARTK